MRESGPQGDPGAEPRLVRHVTPSVRRKIVLGSSILLAVSFLYLIWPLRQLNRSWSDFAFVYTAGKAWIHGHSPYDIPSWRLEWNAVRPIFWQAEDGIAPVQPFFYPPYWIAPASAMALLPWPIAIRVWDLVNVLSFVGLCAMSVELASRRRGLLGLSAVLASLALACLNGSVRYSLYNAQMSLLPTFAVVGAFWAAHEKRAGWLIVFTLLALLKPQIATLPLIYLVLNGSAGPILIAGLFALGLSAWTFLVVDPIRLWQQYQTAYAGHMALDFNALDRFTSVSALFAHCPVGPRGQLWSALAGLIMILAFTIHRVRSKNSALRRPLWQAALCLSMVAAFVPVHDYDLGLYTPLCVLLAELKPRAWGALIATLVLLAGRAPALQYYTHIDPLAPWLTLSTSLAIVFAAWHSSRNSKTAEGNEYERASPR